MYQQNEIVSYGIHGVCRITDTEVRSAKGVKTEYLVLQPLDQPGTRFYIPTKNEAALAKLRPAVTGDQVMDIIRSAQVAKDPWIADENKRKLYYKDLISSGDTVALLSMARSISARREAQSKLHMCDENFLKDAEKLLVSELSLASGIAPEEMRRTLYI